MSAWIVYSKDGKTQRCELKRLEYSGSHMGERAVTATFEYHSEVAFDVFDYIVYRGEKFELESIPSVKKISRNEYEYELRFVSLKYELERCEMRDIVPNDNGVVYPTPLTFSFTGDVRYLADRIQANLDALYGEGVWSIVVANGVSSDEKNISIAQQNCWNALSLVNTTYGLNFSVRGREVVIGGEIDAVSHTFQYGKGNGLYEIERASDTDTGIVTKLRAYGSTKNLDYSYPKKPEWADSVLPVSFALSPLRLMLPSFKEDGKTDYVLADDAVIAKYGIREASIVYDDIYPSIAGAKNSSGQAIDEIASVDAINEESSTFTVYLHDLGFDLEEHLTTAEAQLSMKTGTLQGYTFNISAIVRQGNGGYKLTLGRNSVEGSEESGFNVPNKDWNMKAGDKFVLLNILMPQSYIREAEARLLVRAKEYLAEYGKTNFSYNVGLHDKFLIEHPSIYNSLIEGVKLRVQDNELGISEDVIIQSITITENSDDNILPQVKVTLNNKPSASTLDRIQGKLNDVIAETSANSFSSQNELMAQYRKKLDKPFFDKLFVAIDKDGNEIASNDVATPVSYIKAKYSIATVGGVTMYAEDDVEVPTLAEGLPFDQRTIWFNPETGQIEVIGGTGGSEGGVSNFWELNNIPSWITQAKPTYQYSEIKNTPDLSVYATTSLLNQTLASYVTNNALANTLLSYPTFTDLQDELKGYVNVDYKQDVVGIKNFVNGLQIGELPITKLQDDVIYIDANLVVRGGVTMFYENGELDLPTIIDEIGIAGYDGKKLGLVSFSSSQFSIDANGNVTIKGGSTGLDTAQLAEYLTSNKYATQSWVTSQGYASSSSLSALQNEVHDFLEGSDADNIINKWRELESFLSGLRESDNLSDILATKANQSALDATNATVATKWTQDNNKITQWNTAYGWGDHSKVGYALNSALQALSNVVDTKWTQDNVKISNWDTAYSWGNHASVGYALKSYVDKTFVTIGGTEDVTGLHNFVNGLKIGNVKISKIQDGAIYVEGDLVVKGGVTMYSDSNADFDSIYDGLPIDGTTIYWDNGVLKAKHTEGALTDITSEMVISALGYIPYNASNPNGYITISALDGYVNEISTSGSGNAVTSVSKNGKKITFTKGATFLTEHQDLSGYQTKITSSNKLAYSLISGTPTSLPASDVYSWAKASVKPSYVWGEIGEKPNFASVATSGKYSDLSGTPTSLKNPTSLKFGSKTYDGSSEQTILASDLGAITSHQTIYTLTFQSGIFSAGNFTANSAKQTINVPTTTSHISEGSNLYFTNARAISALKSTTDSLASDIATKWTQNDTKINNWDTAFGWGDHSKNDYTTNKYVDDTFVTLKTEQTITGKKNFTTGGLFVNGKQIHYDATNKYWKLEGDLLVTGGVTMYGVDEGDLPSILDSLPIASTSALGIAKYDSNYFSVNSDGLVTLINAPSSGATSGLLGSFLLNVDDSVDTTPSVDRVLYQPAGSSMWTWKALSEIGGGSSGGGGSVSGNYLPLSGGTITSDGVGLLIKRSNTSPSIGFIGKNDNGTYYYYGYFKYKGQNNPYIEYANGTDYPILHGGNYSSYALPLSGGTLTGRVITWSDLIHIYASSGSGNSYISYFSNDGSTYYGDLGFYNDGSLAMWTSSTKWKKLIHEGNIGSYNAGSATKLQTARTIWGQSFDGTGNVTNDLYLSNHKFVYGTKTDGTRLALMSLNNSNYLIIGTDTAGNGLDTYISGNNINFRYGTSTVVGLKLDSSGNVGIGTTSPAYKLDVNGSFGSTSVQVGSIFLGEGNEINGTGTRLWINYSGSAQLFLGNNGYSTIVGTYASATEAQKAVLGYAPFSVFGTILSYRYGKKASGAAFMFDKPGSNYTGIGSDNTTDTIYLGACDRNGDWVSYNQIWKFGGSILTTGGITMYSDARKKTILNYVELSLKQIANAPLIQHYYNSDQEKTTHVSSIAQYWYGMNDWFCKKDGEGFLTMEIQNLALASAISVARHLERYETKTDKTIRKMKQRIAELEEEVERLKNN